MQRHTLTLRCLWGERACTETVPCLGGWGRICKRSTRNKAKHLTHSFDKLAKGHQGGRFLARSILEKQLPPPSCSPAPHISRCLHPPAQEKGDADCRPAEMEASPLWLPTRGRVAGNAMQPGLGSRNCVSRALVHTLVSS